MKISFSKFAVCAVLLSAIASGPACASDNKMPSQELMNKTEKALSAFAEEISVIPLQPRTVHGYLIDYLKKNPFVYGAAFAFAPAENVDNPMKVSPYVYRHQDHFIVKELVLMGGDYTKAEWYTVPTQTKRPYWSKPYFDKEGGRINMITYSIPVYFNDPHHTLMGVVTSDLPAE